MSAGIRRDEVVGEIYPGYSSTSVEWHIYEIFSLEQTVVYPIHSPCFHFLDATWYLKMNQTGRIPGLSDGYIALYLMRKQFHIPNQHIRFRLKMRMKNDTELKSISTECDFKEGTNGWGFSQFIARSKLLRRKGEFDPKCLLIVSCDLFVRVPKNAEAASQTESQKGLEKLAENFKELLLSGEASDLILSVRGRQFKCHRTVLAARSSVFAAMLRQDMLERSSGVVLIKDCDPEAFKEFLIYIYSGSVENFTQENVLGLYRIADKYDAPEVKARCVHLLTNGLCVENFCDALQLSLQHSESELLQAASNFFAKNSKIILPTISWKNFMKKNPVAANELFLKSLHIH